MEDRSAAALGQELEEDAWADSAWEQAVLVCVHLAGIVFHTAQDSLAIIVPAQSAVLQ